MSNLGSFHHETTASLTSKVVVFAPAERAETLLLLRLSTSLCPCLPASNSAAYYSPSLLNFLLFEFLLLTVVQLIRCLSFSCAHPSLPASSYSHLMFTFLLFFSCLLCFCLFHLLIFFLLTPLLICLKFNSLLLTFTADFLSVQFLSDSCASAYPSCLPVTVNLCLVTIKYKNPS